RGNATTIFARQQSAREWKVRDQRELQARNGRLQRLLDAALEQAVLLLCGDETLQLLRPGGLIGLLQQLGFHVRGSRVADLALANQIFQRAQRLLQRNLRVRPMQIQHVDVVGLQSLQAALRRLHYVAARGAAGETFPRDAEFRGDDDAVASTGECPAQYQLGIAVHIRRIEEVDSERQGTIDDLARGRLVDEPAEVIAAQADGGDLEAGSSQFALLHIELQCGCMLAARPLPQRPSDNEYRLLSRRTARPAPARSTSSAPHRVDQLAGSGTAGTLQ